MICFYANCFFSDRMAEAIEEELNIEEFEIKEEIVSIKEEILPFSTVKDTACTVNLQKDDIKMENTEIQGNFIIECIMFLDKRKNLESGIDFFRKLNKNFQKTIKIY